MFKILWFLSNKTLIPAKITGEAEAKNQDTNTNKVADDGATITVPGNLGAHRKECKKLSIGPSALEHLPEK